MNWFDSWALTLAVFLPAVGLVLVLATPKAQEPVGWPWPMEHGTWPVAL